MGNNDGNGNDLESFIDRLIASLQLAKNALHKEGYGIAPSKKDTQASGDAGDRVAGAFEGLDQRPADKNVDTFGRRTATEQKIRELRRDGYLTNDIVQISGGLETEDFTHFTLNGGPVMKVQRREFMLLLIMCRHSLSQADKKDEGADKGYLSVARILQEVQRLKKEQLGSQCDTFWPHPHEGDIRRLVYNLRDKIRRAGGNPNLIESGERGVGYRLSTPPGNVLIGAQKADREDSDDGPNNAP